MDALAPRLGHIVLDVGCGAGQTIVQLADRVGANGRVIGVDIGQRVLAVARVRTANLSQVTLLRENAEALDLPNGSLDGIYSRFGMMFFNDPGAALSNMRCMLKHGGRIGFVCWRSVQENELDFVPLKAANLAFPIDDAPFSFERSSTIEALLEAAGFGDIAIEAVDESVSSGNMEAMLNVLTRVGALGKILRNNPTLLPGALSARRGRASELRTGRSGQPQGGNLDRHRHRHLKPAHRDLFSVPAPAVMKSARDGSGMSAVCQTLGGLMA